MRWTVSQSGVTIAKLTCEGMSLFENAPNKCSTALNSYQYPYNIPSFHSSINSIHSNVMVSLSSYKLYHYHFSSEQKWELEELRNYQTDQILVMYLFYLSIVRLDSVLTLLASRSCIPSFAQQMSSVCWPHCTYWVFVYHTEGSTNSWIKCILCRASCSVSV